MESFRRNRRRGAALMLSLWALFLLSALVMSWALEVGSRLSMSGNASRNLEALALACSGAEIAQHPLTKPGSPALVGGFGRNQTFEARITGEGGRINLKFLMPNLMAEDLLARDLLARFLEIKGVELNERDRMIHTLCDWVDPDNLVRLNGAEEEGGYRAANRMFTRIDELKKVMGWDEFTSAENWDSDLTLDSEPGKINLAWASRDVLLSLPGTDEMRVDQFLTMRPGGDGIDGNEDDMFTDAQINEVLSILGIPPQLQPFVEFKKDDPIRRIISVGESGTITRTVQAVFKIAAGSNTQKSWKEF